MLVFAVAVAALPAVAILLAVVTRMESSFFGDNYLDDAAVRDRYLGAAYSEPSSENVSDGLPA